MWFSCSLLFFFFFFFFIPLSFLFFFFSSPLFFWFPRFGKPKLFPKKKRKQKRKRKRKKKKRMIQEVLSSLGWGKDEGWIEEQDLSPDSHLSWLPALDESSSSSSSCSPSSSSSSSSSFSHGNDCLNGGGWVDAKVGVDDGSYSSSLIFGVSDQVVQIFLGLFCFVVNFFSFSFLLLLRLVFVYEISSFSIV